MFFGRCFEQQYKKYFTCDELFIKYYVVVIISDSQYIVPMVVIILKGFLWFGYFYVIYIDLRII